MAALVIVFAGIKLAAEIVGLLLALFIAIICSPVIKAMTQRKVPWYCDCLVVYLNFNRILFPGGIN